MKTIEEYADDIEARLARFHILGRADIGMNLIACALGAEITDTARVEAIRRIVAADELVSQRLAEALGDDETAGPSEEDPAVVQPVLSQPLKLRSAYR